MKSNIPDYRVTLDGTDLTPRLKGRTQNADPAKRRPRLVSITIAQRRGEEPDKLTVSVACGPPCPFCRSWDVCRL